MIQSPRLIPGRTNAIALGLLFPTLLLLLMFGPGTHGITFAVATIAFSILGFTAYCFLHEAEHELLFESRFLNDGAGVMLGLFFPAPFHLLRQGHLGHHARNRTDTEAFDLYHPNRPREKWMRRFQLYGTLTGIWYLVVVLSNVLAFTWPLPLLFRRTDRSARALLSSFNPEKIGIVRLEALLALLFHGTLLWLSDSPGFYLLMYFFSGLLWSSQQYLHHYGTERHPERGARNVRTWKFLDLLWLNHNLHLTHHLKPSLPWIHLRLNGPPATTTMMSAYWQMWRGPVADTSTVMDVTEGRVV